MEVCGIVLLFVVYAVILIVILIPRQIWMDDVRHSVDALKALIPPASDPPKSDKAEKDAAVVYWLKRKRDRDAGKE